MPILHKDIHKHLADNQMWSHTIEYLMNAPVYDFKKLLKGI